MAGMEPAFARLASKASMSGIAPKGELAQHKAAVVTLVLQAAGRPRRGQFRHQDFADMGG